MRRNLLAGLLLLLGAGGALSGCFNRETNVSAGNRDGILHRGIGPAPAHLDPHLATSLSEYHVIAALFEGLVAPDPTNGNPAPGVAQHWDVSPDGLTHTFRLRANARWSNGDPVTARDFLRSWQRLLTPALGADYAHLLFVVAGAEDYHQGRETDFARVGFSAPDDRTVRISLAHPTPYFLSLLQHWAWFPVHVDSIAAYGSPTDRATAWARPGRLVGNGPFTLTSWSGGQRLIATRASTYWDATTVRLQAIHFHPIDSVEAEERAFRAGQLHLTEALPVTRIDHYREHAPELLRIDPYLGTYFYRINVARPFLNAAAVRRALALALDRQAIVTTLLRGGQTPAWSFVPPGLEGYQPPAAHRTDFAAARAELAAAGYPGGRGAPRIELLFNTSENHRVIAEAIQEMWRRELGLEVSLVNMEFRSTLQARRAGDYQILRSAWIADYPDPASFLDIWRTQSGNNYTGWNSPAYDRLLFEAARTGDTTRRASLLAQAEALLLREAPIIPIYHYTHVYLRRPEVRGWHPHPLDQRAYKHVWLETTVD